MNNNIPYYSVGQNIRFDMLTPEQERALWVKAKDENDEAAREYLIRNHLLFAMMHAETLVGGRLPRNEVTSAANFALMKAYERFDYRKGFKFNTYLRPFIRGEISELWRSKFSGGIPDPSLGSKEYTGNDGIKGLAMGGLDPLDNDRLVPTVEHEAEGEDLKRFNIEQLKEALKVLNKKDAALIRMVYVQGKSMADVARQRGVSRAAVQATHTKIMGKLRKILKRAKVEL